ncbi:hypothetical protein Y032_0013g2094 [Ancylostoma ceylanicum]|uniref:Uncharacterized protein n=1 Tax=Ancylostoma ceylanicum TaxID=53326 RepID=A0A016VBD4_9BILA|nr:hypothetical protein Y032_0013g2094 [Ancylostoma ceylanicum]
MVGRRRAALPLSLLRADRQLHLTFPFFKLNGGDAGFSGTPNSLVAVTSTRNMSESRYRHFFGCPYIYDTHCSAKMRS